MKIESCPKCGEKPRIYYVSAGVLCVHTDSENGIHYFEWSNTKLGAIIKWNRFCRRERRRMKKEAGK